MPTYSAEEVAAIDSRNASFQRMADKEGGGAAGSMHFHPDAATEIRRKIAGDELMSVCISAGGVLSGEHGIGLEKRDHMHLLFSADDLDAQARLRDAFDPDRVLNPAKVLPAGSRCGDLQRLPEGAWV